MAYANEGQTWIECKKTLDGIDDYRTGIGIAVSVFTTTALLLNILLLLIFYRQRHEAKLLTYKNMQSLSFAQIIYLICNYPLMIPCTFFICDFYLDVVMISIAWMNTMGYYTAITVNCFIGIERISLFLLPSFHHFIESHPIKYVGIPWVFGATITICTTAMGCFKRYNTYSLHYTFECGTCHLWPGFSITDFLLFFCQVAVIAMLLGYAIVILTVFCKSTSGRAVKSREASLVMQASFICVCQWISATAFYVAPIIFGETIVGGIATNLIGLVNAAINPIVLIIFNKMVQRGLLPIFGLTATGKTTRDTTMVTAKVAPVPQKQK